MMVIAAGSIASLIGVLVIFSPPIITYFPGFVSMHTDSVFKNL